MKKLFFLAIIFCLSNCQKEDSESFRATVLQKGIDCGEVWLIEFRDEVQTITGLDEQIYYADKLPDALKQENLAVRLNFRNPTAQDVYACTDLGPAYPHIIVTLAQE